MGSLHRVSRRIDIGRTSVFGGVLGAFVTHIDRRLTYEPV
ncbi:hypothetical protein BRPE64_CCDS00100 [Caballeronia insecticola]|uniref:Uncharacterized protein n=1 Tax=Caballeronia insecticola TaxID=758793 RepID=R4WN70_9BURK|nr:hypothetical protein BRPE64_CCDS00100 [Caballeronia insecticola]